MATADTCHDPGVLVGVRRVRAVDIWSDRAPKEIERLGQLKGSSFEKDR